MIVDTSTSLMTQSSVSSTFFTLNQSIMEDAVRKMDKNNKAHTAKSVNEQTFLFFFKSVSIIYVLYISFLCVCVCVNRLDEQTGMK